MNAPKAIGILKNEVSIHLEQSILAVTLKARDLGYETIATDNIDLLTTEAIAGLIYTNRREADAPMLQRIQALGFPLVTANLAMPGLSSVTGDNAMGMRQAVQHLASLGHQRIVYLRGPRGVYSAGQRYQGFVSALNELNINFDPSLVAQGGFDVYQAREEMYNLLASRNDFTAVIGGNDKAAIGAIAAIRQAGYKVPEDFAVVSYCNFAEIHSQTTDKVTAVHYPVYRIGLEAAEMLHERIQNSDLPLQSRVIPTHLVVRETCGGSLLEIEPPKTRKEADDNLLHYLLEAAGDLDREQIDSLVHEFRQSSDESTLDNLKRIFLYGIDLGLNPLVFHNLLVEVLGDFDYWSLKAKGSPSKSQVLRALQDRSRDKVMFYQRYHQDAESRFAAINEQIFNLHVEEQSSDDFGYAIRELQTQLRVRHIALVLLDEPCISLSAYAGPATLWRGNPSFSIQSEEVAFSLEEIQLADLMPDTGSLRSGFAIEIKSMEGILGLLLLDFDTEFALFAHKLAPLLSVKLQRARLFESLRRQAEELASESERSKQARKTQEELRQQAEHANRAKSEFLTVMSHELRTPLNTIIGMTDIALDSQLDERLSDQLHIVRGAADSLLSIVNNLLDFSKLESGSISLSHSLIDLRSRLAKSLDAHREAADSKGITLRCEVDPSIPQQVIGDGERLKQLLLHLIENAIKFTEEGEVSVSAKAYTTEDDSVTLVFCVKDTGIGIPYERQPEIFDIIKRAESGDASLYGGSALGLSIAARMAKQMSGRIWLESEPGSGSAFSVSLPFELPIETSRSDPSENPFYTDQDPPERNPRLLVFAPSYDIEALAAEDPDLESLRISSAATIGSAIELWSEGNRSDDSYDAVLVEQAALGDRDFNRMESTGYFRNCAFILIVSDERAASFLSEHRAVSRLSEPLRKEELIAILSTLCASNDSDDSDPIQTIGSEPSANAADSEQRETLRILIIDDNASNQLVAQNMLEKVGHTVSKAYSAPDGIELWQRGNFDMILMDVQMPEIDGWEATRRIREKEKERGKRTVIIALTSHAIDGYEKKCYDAGMDGYISKPIERESFLRYIAEAPKRLQTSDSQ